MASSTERELLLKIAREAIADHVGAAPAHVPDEVEILARPGAAFVTLHKRGALRGCIGHIESVQPLGQVVPRCAVSAATSDPRFPPLAPDELDAIEIEISLLGPLEPITGPQDILVGRHGLVVERGWQRGLLLPQVATEWQWNAQQFLAHTCEKAGLPPDAWQKDAKIWRFEAEVFSEG